MTSTDWRLMDTAPRDGTSILAARDTGCGWEAYVVWWNRWDSKYPWWFGDNNGFPEGRLDVWRPVVFPDWNEANH